VTERASKHARRRSVPAAELEAVATARVRHLGSPAPGGWVPAEPTPIALRENAITAGLAAAAVRDRLPLAVRGIVVEPRARALAGIVGVLVLGLLLGGLLIWRGRPASEPVPPVQRSAPSVSAATLSPTASSTSASTLVVHVAGAVRRPGLVQLGAGARVADAVAAAGGPARNAELASVNLARPVVDGEQLVVLARGQGPAVAAPPAAGGPAASAAPIDLNSATLEQLDTLPGVGPVLAQRILDWRSEHGRFGSTDELREVSGIGEATFADIKSLVRV
jgi:competence protein ComEA